MSTVDWDKCELLKSAIKMVEEDANLKISDNFKPDEAIGALFSNLISKVYALGYELELERGNLGLKEYRQMVEELKLDELTKELKDSGGAFESE